MVEVMLELQFCTVQKGTPQKAHSWIIESPELPYLMKMKKLKHTRESKMRR